MQARSVTMKNQWAAVLSGLMLLSTAACSDSMGDKPMPEYKENPNPGQAYRLTMRIDNAPGPLKIIVSAAQYDVVNRECLPPPKENPGGHLSPVPTNDIPFELTRVSDNEYIGVVYADGMIDEDYHDRGVCRWSLIQAQVQLKATGAEDEAKFIASLSRDEFRLGEAKTIYYWNGRYPRAGMDNFPVFGETDQAKYKTEILGDLFSIALFAEEVK